MSQSKYILLPDGYCLEVTKVTGVSKVMKMVIAQDSFEENNGEYPLYHLIIYIKSDYPKYISQSDYNRLSEIRSMILRCLDELGEDY